MAYDIEVTRSRTDTIKVYVVGENRKAYTLANGEVLVLGVKKRSHYTDLVIKKTATTGTNGIYEFHLSPADTEHLPCGKYFYDIGLQSGDEYYEVIKKKAFRISENITKSGDGNG